MLSVCMIVKDEEARLGRCLASLGNEADEIVVADTGSRDKTREEAERMGARVFSFPWREDFSAARNFSFEQAAGDLIMWLDADDVIPAEMLPRLRALKARMQAEQADMALCRYASGGTVYFRERIVRRAAGFAWTGRVHECIAPRGKVIRDDFCITHCGSGDHSARNLRIYQAWRAEEALSPRDLFYYGRELFYNRLYTEACAVLEEMLSGEGWYVNKIEACRVLARCLAARGRTEEALGALLRSFRYGTPRGGVCHEIGRMFQEKGALREAVQWYEWALACPDRSPEGDFDLPEERTLYPLLGLTYCRYALGDREGALACHARAAALAPDHPSVRHNAAFFGT